MHKLKSQLGNDSRIFLLLAVFLLLRQKSYKNIINILNYSAKIFNILFHVNFLIPVHFSNNKIRNFTNWWFKAYHLKETAYQLQDCVISQTRRKGLQNRHVFSSKSLKTASEFREIEEPIHFFFNIFEYLKDRSKTLIWENLTSIWKRLYSP